MSLIVLGIAFRQVVVFYFLLYLELFVIYHYHDFMGFISFAQQNYR